MKTITLVYGVPDKLLNPNEHVGWRKKSKAEAKRKLAVRWDTIRQIRLAGMPDDMRWKHVTATIMWYHRTWMRPDRDNALRMLKSTWDGMEEAGLLLNDKYLTPNPVEFEEDKERPRVVITLERTG